MSDLLGLPAAGSFRAASVDRRCEFRLTLVLAVCNKGKSPSFCCPSFLICKKKGNKGLELRKLCVDKNELAAHKTFRVVLGTLQISKNPIICLCSKLE